MSDVDLSSPPRNDAAAGSVGCETVVQPILRPSYGILLGLYMAGITFLSSIPRDPALHQPVVEYGINLAHIPLFAGLTFLLIKTIAPGGRGRMPGWFYPSALIGLVVFAALDEWHQSFVPGRSSSVIDLMLDTMGVGAVLLFYRLSDLIADET